VVENMHYVSEIALHVPVIDGWRRRRCRLRRIGRD
jgi:hypothetical protein